MKSISQLWQEIEVWFVEHQATQNLGSLQNGASEDDLLRLETKLGFSLPEDLRVSLSLHNGGGDFESYEYLGTAGIFREWDGRSQQSQAGHFNNWDYEDSRGILQEGFWNEGWLPFACDSAGNLICIDTNPGPAGRHGQLVYFEWQDRQGPYGARERTFHTWLESFRNKLYAGKLIVNDEGFIDEPRLIPSVKPSAPKLTPLPYKSLGEPLLDLIKAGRIRPVAAFIKTNSIDVRHTIFSSSLVSWAAQEGHLPLVRFFILKLGLDPNLEESQAERTALFWAVWGPKAKLEIVQFLLAHGAHVNAQTAYDGTSLHAAVMWEHPHIIRYLLEQGANPLITDAKGRTPLVYAYENQQRGRNSRSVQQIIDLLESAQADPSSLDSSRR